MASSALTSLWTLAAQLRGTPCRVFRKDIKVQVGPYRASSRRGLYAYSDLLVLCGEPQVHDVVRDISLNSRVIVEVLPPSTSVFDRNAQFDRRPRHTTAPAWHRFCSTPGVQAGLWRRQGTSVAGR